MLVLSRKSGEKILIGEEIEIVVVEVRGERIKLGIACPQKFRVLRGELEKFSDTGLCPQRQNILPGLTLPTV